VFRSISELLEIDEIEKQTGVKTLRKLEKGK
jgi:hypothetical protein